MATMTEVAEKPVCRFELRREFVECEHTPGIRDGGVPAATLHSSERSRDEARNVLAQGRRIQQREQQPVGMIGKVQGSAASVTTCGKWR